MARVVQSPKVKPPPGLVAVISQDTGRFTVFYASLSAMTANLPAGSQVEWFIGHDIPSNHNAAVRALLADTRLQWLLIMGDDHMFEPDLCERLLAHGRDIVVPLCLTRVPPYEPVVFVATDRDGGRRRLNLDTLRGGGLIECLDAGGAGMLIRRHVFEAMPEPWFEYGRIDPTLISEDTYFCVKAWEAGFTTWVDLDTQLGHCLTGAVWPVQTSTGGWTRGFTLAGGTALTI